MCVFFICSRLLVHNPPARIIAQLRQKKYGPLQMIPLFRPLRIRRPSFVSWESWRTGMERIPLIERLVSARWDVCQGVMSFTTPQITIMKCNSCEYSKRWLGEASPVFHDWSSRTDTNIRARSRLPSLPACLLLAFVTLCPG
jgi:hypothetical protein